MILRYNFWFFLGVEQFSKRLFWNFLFWFVEWLIGNRPSGLVEQDQNIIAHKFVLNSKISDKNYADVFQWTDIFDLFYYLPLELIDLAKFGILRLDSRWRIPKRENPSSMLPECFPVSKCFCFPWFRRKWIGDNAEGNFLKMIQ